MTIGNLLYFHMSNATFYHAVALNNRSNGPSTMINASDLKIVHESLITYCVASAFMKWENYMHFKRTLSYHGNQTKNGTYIKCSLQFSVTIFYGDFLWVDCDSIENRSFPPFAAWNCTKKCRNQRPQNPGRLQQVNGKWQNHFSNDVKNWLTH